MKTLEWPSTTFWLWVVIYAVLNACAWIGASGWF
jgi:hypothetical protein